MMSSLAAGLPPQSYHRRVAVIESERHVPRKAVLDNRFSLSGVQIREVKGTMVGGGKRVYLTRVRSGNRGWTLEKRCAEHPKIRLFDPSPSTLNSKLLALNPQTPHPTSEAPARAPQPLINTAPNDSQGTPSGGPFTSTSPDAPGCGTRTSQPRSFPRDGFASASHRSQNQTTTCGSSLCRPTLTGSATSTAPPLSQASEPSSALTVPAPLWARLDGRRQIRQSITHAWKASLTTFHLSGPPTEPNVCFAPEGWV